MKSVLVFIFLVLSYYSMFSATYLVSNGNHPSADFTTIAAAVTGSVDGDTLYIDGTGSTYGSLTLSAPRVIIGNGYFGQESGYGQSAVLGTVTIQASATNSQLIGLTLGSVSVSASSVILQRCYITSTQTLNADGIVVKQCYIAGFVNIQSTNTNAVFDHCIFNYSTTGTILTDLGTGTFIDFNTFYKGNLSLGTATYSNCIFNQTKVASLTGGTDAGGNISDTETNLTFPATAATDDELQLTAGSSALTTSLEAGESGAFGFLSGSENSVYRLSGIPPIPIISSIQAASTSKEGSNLSITIEAKTNN